MKKKFTKEKTINISKTSANIELTISPDLFWFEGHFKSQPLLPGVTQLNWVIYYTQKYFDNSLRLLSIDVIKFQCPVLPKDRLILHLAWYEKIKKLEFSYTIITPNSNKVASTGKLSLCH
ncbi:ApeI family dehydratase [Gilliamella sp. ESL0250]|uniref:ApeI family dehydratase n=1 Tax=Gilliamella sp. ESL0250 TaxID=2705036 RepID=UPI0015810FC8|nr:hydroxymyristoyl-ACP dehydratase [Gilliamella sp. ESL0250]NUF48710.1 hydroxymyristoyl-ACP dehydratase [Gilliamella sp. ESL0250]